MRTNQLNTGDLVTINGDVQYYDTSQCKIVSDPKFTGQKASVAETNYFGELAKLKIDKKYVLAHPNVLTKANDSDDFKWITTGAIVRVIGPISTRTIPHYYHTYNYTIVGSMGVPSRTTTDKYKDKLAEVLSIQKSWRTNQEPYLELLIKGKRGGKTYAVCWPSSLEPVLSL